LACIGTVQDTQAAGSVQAHLHRAAVRGKCNNNQPLVPPALLAATQDHVCSFHFQLLLDF
jgi:hypothetical protein